MDVKIKLIIIFIIFSCVLYAQEEIDISKLARKKAIELETQGWKVHSGSSSIYEQLYSAYAYEIYNDTNNPLQRLYKGIAPDRFNCVISMLKEYAKLDIHDWFSEYEESFRKNNAGLVELVIAGELTYSECVCYLDYLYSELEKKTYFEIGVSNISDDFHVNYRSFIIPFVSLYRRNQEGNREEMLVAAFTDEFLENRRIKIPIFGEFNSRKHLYHTTGIENTSQTSEGVYEEHSIIHNFLEGERIRVIAEAEYKLKE